MFEVKKDWITKAGLRAVVLFVHNSHHCGYVAVSTDSPYFGKGYDDEALGFVAVHGGLTFSESSASLKEDHPLKSVESVSWFGFDCAHLGDATAHLSHDGDVFRDVSYVESECESLAEQLCIGVTP
jgi:hypothetical protein